MIQNIYGLGQLFAEPTPQTSGGTNAAPSSAPAAAIAEPQDRVTLSKQAQDAKNDDGAGEPKDEKDLDGEKKEKVNQLKSREIEVKAHEQAHMASGGGLVQGGASYEYERGPDGKMYAVGGEVQIDVSPENTPEATVAKMQQVQRAALAPAQPSGADRAVAARAAQVEARARAEKTQANAPSTNTAGPEQPFPADETAASSSPSLKGYPQGPYVMRTLGKRSSWKNSGLKIDLKA